LIKGAAGKLTLFFFGGADGVASEARASINRLQSPLQCVGALSPGFGPLTSLGASELIDTINDADPDFVAVSLGKNGKPWMARYAPEIRRGVVAHLGAVVNFAAGTVARAPAPMRVSGLEWAWRIWQEPKLWRRYCLDALSLGRYFTTHVLPLKIDQVLGRSRRGGIAYTLTVTKDEARFLLQGSLTGENIRQLRDEIASIAVKVRSFEFDLSKVDYIDSAGVGLLLLAFGWQCRTSGQCRIVNCSRSVQRTLRLSACSYLLHPLRVAGHRSPSVADAVHA
jgi:N-acetylglucosaminyldiphosphoundecaprenol N-acetyl-beta-D-mannosaminyltransferase